MLLRISSGGGRNNSSTSLIPLTCGIEGDESVDKEDGSSITGGGVTEAVTQLLGGKAPGVHEVRPEFLKGLNVVELSWLTCV